MKISKCLQPNARFDYTLLIERSGSPSSLAPPARSEKIGKTFAGFAESCITGKRIEAYCFLMIRGYLTIIRRRLVAKDVAEVLTCLHVVSLAGVIENLNA